MLRVFNRRRPREIPKGAVYVGRPTQWGNPFRKGSKAKNIADFKAYAEKRKRREPNWLKPLKGKHLVCWCSPAGCHGDVLLKMANEVDASDGSPSEGSIDIDNEISEIERLEYDAFDPTR